MEEDKMIYKDWKKKPSIKADSEDIETEEPKIEKVKPNRYKNDFLCYMNTLVKSKKLEAMTGKYCCLILDNGYRYQGILMIVYDDAVVFIDERQGKKKFPRNRIFVVYQTPIAAKHREYK